MNDNVLQNLSLCRLAFRLLTEMAVTLNRVFFGQKRRGQNTPTTYCTRCQSRSTRVFIEKFGDMPNFFLPLLPYKYAKKLATLFALKPYTSTECTWFHGGPPCYMHSSSQLCQNTARKHFLIMMESNETIVAQNTRKRHQAWEFTDGNKLFHNPTSCVLLVFKLGGKALLCISLGLKLCAAQTNKPV